MSEYDLIVIGAGPGGYVGAIRAAQLGLNVACVEGLPKLGGTCLNIGCIPSKALLDSSEKYYALKHYDEIGIKVASPKLDLAAMMANKNKVVDRLTSGVDYLFKKYKVNRIEGLGKVIPAKDGKHRVEVEFQKQKQQLTAKNIIIATGSVPSKIPFLPIDEKRILTSTGALALEEVPTHLMIVGGGYIGLEMGSVWARLGSKVTVIEVADALLPTMDQELVRDFKRQLETQGIEFRLSTKCTSLDEKKGSLVLGLEVGRGTMQTLEGSHVLVSVGRTPYTVGLGLDSISIEIDHGYIKVNDRFETNVPGIFAIGDVIGGAMLAHKAEEEGAVLAEIIGGISPSPIDYALIPSVIYTDPEVASIGFTEDELKARVTPYVKGVFPFTANGRAIAMGNVHGKVKILAHATTKKILGVHIMGPQASSLIGEAVAVMKRRGTLNDIADACHPHPTLTEAVKEAALVALGHPIHI